MIRQLPVKSVVSAASVTLPMNALLALGKDATGRPTRELFNVPGAATAVLGDWDRAVRVLNPRIWAPEWNRDQIRAFLRVARPTPSSIPETSIEELLEPSFLGVLGRTDTESRRAPTYDVVHCVCQVGSNYDGDPLLFFGLGHPYIAITSGMLRDALVKSGTRLLVLQELNHHGISTEMPAARLAEFIAVLEGRQYWSS